MPLDTTKRDKLWTILSDPIISLADAAQIIGVHPGTVRRYTNAGALKCLRTPGNQRRFKLSDVMKFIEERGEWFDEMNALSMFADGRADDIIEWFKEIGAAISLKAIAAEMEATNDKPGD